VAQEEKNLQSVMANRAVVTRTAGLALVRVDRGLTIDEVVSAGPAAGSRAMDTRTAILRWASLAILLLAGCRTRQRSEVPSPSIPSARTQRVLASDPRFVYEGRFDHSDPNAPVVIWQASRVRLDFEGDAIDLLFDKPKGQCFFNAQVDGSTKIVEVREGSPPLGSTISGLGPGRHHLVLFKRSEADAGTARFRGASLPPGAQAWRPAPIPYRLRMEFIGDSITAGACNEDGQEDQWEDRRTHNAALSYAALTAAAFNADHRNIAVSGMGISTGWVEKKAGQVWDRLYPDASSPRADLQAWTPDIVFVNLGENDDSFPKAHGQPFPAGYTDGYIALVQAVRTAYPRARIVLLRGGMSGGSQSGPLRHAWEAAVARLEATDQAVSHFVFTHWSTNHPRVLDHHALTAELTGRVRP